MSDFQIYSSKFFWGFKRMDNVNYNFKIAEILISTLKTLPRQEDEREYFYKPIIMILTSIIERILYDFLVKVQQHKYEKVPNLAQEDILAIKDINLPRAFTSFIEICEKYELLGKKDDQIYKSLRSFANFRNRIHIQNVSCDKPVDEGRLWTNQLVKGCGKLLKDVCLMMCRRYPRPQDFHSQYVIPRSISFPEPWHSI